MDSLLGTVVPDHIASNTKMLFNNKLTFQSLAVYFRTTRFNVQKFCMALALRCVFYTDLRTDSDFSFIDH